MSEDEILRNLYYFTSSKIKNKKLSLQDLSGFDLGYLNVETIQKSVEGLVDLYEKEQEKNKESENCLQMAKQIMTVDISEDFDCMKLKEFKEYLLNEMKLNENFEE